MPGFQANISGRVQGVGFRWFVQRNAERLGVNGYVRNLPDGGVEVEAEGDAHALELLIAELKKGPGMSHVQDVNVIWKNTNKGYSGFSISH
jgi:acylphosphatase